MTNFIIEYINVAFASVTTYFLMLYPMWKTRERKIRFVFVYTICHALLGIAALLFFRRLGSTDIEAFSVFKFVIGVPMVPLAFFVFRQRVWQNIFALVISSSYGVIPQGAGNYALEHWSSPGAYPMLASTAITIAVIAATLPPLLIILRRLYENPGTKQAIAFWRLAWLMPMIFFVMFLMGNNYLFDNDIYAVSFFVFRGVVYGGLFFICYLLDAVLRQVNEAETAKREVATLERLDRQKNDLMHTISHEARTPLAVLANYSGLLAMELKAKGTDAQTAADLDKIVFESKRVAELIDSVKLLTLYSGESQLKTGFGFDDLIRQTARMYRHIFERDGVALDMDIEDGLTVFGSPEQLTQVVFNIMQNAKNHTRQGSVSITAKKDKDNITITVTDTGTGIPPELLPRVFERGVTEGSDAGNPIGGSGIGLALCKEITEAHGGTINIESKQGQGTSVRIILPGHKEGGANEK